MNILNILRQRPHFLPLIVLFIVLSNNAQAKVWGNAYINFEIPDRWKCVLEQTEWVCRSEDGQEAKEAIIILTAKEIGPTDTFPIYEQHLGSPIQVALRDGGSDVSKVYKKPEYSQIQSLRWIDGFHLGSEVPNYFTRYLATLKEKIAVLVTFSAHKDVYAKYSTDFMRAIQSLRVIASKNLLNTAGANLRPSSGSLFQTGMKDLLPAEPMPGDMPKKKKDNTLYLALAGIISAIGIYLFIKSRKS